MFRLLTRLSLLLLLLPTVAVAQEPGTVTVPWGDWVTHGIDILLPTALTVLSGVATYVIAAYMPPWLKAFAGDAAQRRVNQVLEKAILSAVARTKNAVVGKRLSIPVANTVLQKAAQYAVDQAPDLIAHATHDEVGNLVKMLTARMEQWGIAPEKPDPAMDKAAASKAKISDFDKAIKSHLGG